MKMRIFAIRDKKAEAFLQPFFAPTDGAATRSFCDAVGDKASQFCKHPEDYYLSVIGVYDDATGRIEAFESPLQLFTAEQAQALAG